MLRPNLEALARRDPELVQRIGWPVESDHVVMDDSGEIIYRLQQGRYRLSLSEDAVRRSLPAGAPEGAEIFVFGVGLGELIEAILSPAAARPDLRVVAWERDPWLLRLALGQNDWTAALASGRLRLLLGSDLVEAAVATAGRVATGPTVVHPFLAAVYRQERTWLVPETAVRPLVLLCAGGVFTDDLASALGALGFALYTLDLRRLSREELDREAARLRPTLIAAINYTEGLAEFAAAHRCKLICWEVDPTTSAPPRCPTEDAAAGAAAGAGGGGAFLFTYRRAQVEELRAGGFAHVEYLPLGADPARRTPVPLTGADRARYGAPVSFVGSSLQPQAPGFRQSFLTGFATGDPGAVSRATALLDEVLAEQRQDFSRDLIAGALARRCPDLARADPARLAQLARWAGEIAAAEKRLAYVARLGRFGARVWGDEGWQSVNRARLPTEVEYLGPAGHGLELTKIYCATQVNVDIGRLYQADIVTMRVFDVLACGGFVLAERSPALAELFEIGVEVECYATADELSAKVAHYLAHPAAAQAIALRGRAAVQQRHTIAARVARMLAVSGARAGDRAGGGDGDGDGDGAQVIR
jgi:spore maturation protein CgeB